MITQRIVKNLIVYVKVIPNAKEDRVLGQDEKGIYKIRVTASPDKGKANQAVVDILAKHFDRPKRCVIIKSGFTDRLKTVIIEEK